MILLRKNSLATHSRVIKTQKKKCRSSSLQINISAAAVVVVAACSSSFTSSRAASFSPFSLFSFSFCFVLFFMKNLCKKNHVIDSKTKTKKNKKQEKYYCYYLSYYFSIYDKMLLIPMHSYGEELAQDNIYILQLGKLCGQLLLNSFAVVDHNINTILLIIIT